MTLRKESTLELIRNSCEQSLAHLNRDRFDTLGFMYAQFPGQSTWEKCYVIHKNCQLLFLSSMNSHAPKFVYVINEANIRPKRKYVFASETTSLTKIDTLMIFHKYDTIGLYLTIPAAHEYIASKDDPPVIKETLSKFQAKI